MKLILLPHPHPQTMRHLAGSGWLGWPLAPLEEFDDDSRRARPVSAPSEEAAIEDQCLRFHAPADQYSKRTTNAQLALSEVTGLGREGVTCTVCHQIETACLGHSASFTGSFNIGTKDRIYRPFPEPFTMPMLHHIGFTATEASHIRRGGCES